MDKIEQAFFEIFEIEPGYTCTAYRDMDENLADKVCDDSCGDCKYYKKERYPEITGRRLLDIASVSVDWTGSLLIVDKNIKNEILEEAIFIAHRKDTDEFVRQIQALFKAVT